MQINLLRNTGLLAKLCKMEGKELSNNFHFIVITFVSIFCLLLLYNMRPESQKLIGNYSNNKELHFYRLEYCDCDRTIVQRRPDDKMASNKTTCGPLADLRGPMQKVVSFSFYGNSTFGYFQGIETNAKSIAKLYPGWVMRLYHNIDRKDEVNTKALCKILCNNTNIDDCYVGSLPQPLGSVLDILGSMWRFLVLGDPMVDVFVSRDLDAIMGQREVDAVNQWLESNYTWHIMRDHVNHPMVMLAGMWGVKNSNNLPLMSYLRYIILQQPRKFHKQYDQDVLRDFVYPTAREDMLNHDSYLCEMFNGTSPYPTRRMNLFFIGNYFGSTINMTCPVKCRPVEHQDWENC